MRRSCDHAEGFSASTGTGTYSPRRTLRSHPCRHQRASFRAASTWLAPSSTATSLTDTKALPARSTRAISRRPSPVIPVPTRQPYTRNALLVRNSGLCMSRQQKAANFSRTRTTGLWLSRQSPGSLGSPALVRLRARRTQREPTQNANIFKAADRCVRRGPRTSADSCGSFRASVLGRIDPVEELLQVQVHHPLEALLQMPPGFGYCRVTASPRSETVAAPVERRLVVRAEHLVHRLLYDPIHHVRYAKSSLAAACLRDPDPADQAGPITSVQQRASQRRHDFADVLAHLIDAYRSRLHRHGVREVFPGRYARLRTMPVATTRSPPADCGLRRHEPARPGVARPTALRLRSGRYCTFDFHQTPPHGTCLGPRGSPQTDRYSGPAPLSLRCGVPPICRACHPRHALPRLRLGDGAQRQGPQRTSTSYLAPMPGAPAPCGHGRRAVGVTRNRTAPSGRRLRRRARP